MRLPRLPIVLLAASIAPAGAQTRPTISRHTHPHHHEPVRHHQAVVRHPHPAPHRGPARHVAAVPAPPPPVVAPAPPPPPPVGTVTGLPLPRFASLRSEEVNMRSGPGTRYPIQWVYQRRDLPIEIEREFDVWRLIRTEDGTEGWVHQATLISNRTFVTLPTTAAATPGTTTTPGTPTTTATPTTGPLATAQTVRAAAADDAAPVAYLKPGVIGHVLSCPAASDWCRVTAGGATGFLPRRAMWGLLLTEVVAAH